MKTTTIILLITLSLSVNAQNIQQRDPILRKKKGISEMLNIQGKSYNELFRNKKNQFDGKIVIVNENTIMYDDEVLFINNTDKRYIRIFEKGIFYPGIITGLVKKGQERKEELKSMLIRNDSLTISDFNEQKNYFTTPKERLFKFLLFNKRFMNPTEYHIVLSNENLEIETDLDTFLNGAKLTTIEVVSILI
jgi:hypothetical protein